jgi:hypothetical protein
MREVEGLTGFKMMNKSKERQRGLFITLDIRKLKSRVRGQQLFA